MATAQELREALADFCGRVNADPRLRQMTRDWNRTIHVVATDSGDAFTLRLRDGEVSLHEGALGEAEITMAADSELLADIFWGDTSPTEPWLDGRLRLRASEEDTVRIDVIALMVWGE